MATQDNNLGAPSEGFGQTVTFAFHPDGGGVPRLGGENPVQLRAGVQGDPSVGDGRTMSPGVQLPKSDPTMAALLKIGGGVIAPYIKQHQQEKFIEGMQRAMAGEAVQDIAKSEPWYANLFGNSDVVEGARAYKASAAVSDVIGQMEADMPNLRKMGSQDATSYFNQRVQNGLTGDASTDMHIMRAVQQQLPSLMKRQAKEHYGWQQEEASKAESDARWKAAKSLQEGAVGLANGTITNDEFLGRQGAFAQLLLPAAGRDQENWQGSLSADMRRWADAGLFHAFTVAKDSGAYSHLKPEQQLQVDRAADLGESLQRSKFSMMWNDDMGRIREFAEMPPPGRSTDDLKRDIDNINERYSKMTGSRQGLITPTERAAYLSQSAVAIRREENRQADLAAANAAKQSDRDNKDADKASIEAIVMQRASTGTLGTLKSNKNYGPSVIDPIATKMYLGMSPDQQVKFLANEREHYTIEPIKNSLEGGIEAALSAGEYTTDMQAAFQRYSMLREQNPFVADRYYGAYAHKLEGFYNDVKLGMSPAGAFRQHFVAPSARADLDPKEEKQAVETVANDYNSWLPAWAGGDKLEVGQGRRIVSEISDGLKLFKPATGDIREAAKRAFMQGKANGLEVMGGYAWTNGKGQQPLEHWLTQAHGDEAPLPTDKISNLFNGAVKESLAATMEHPGDVSDLAVFRLPDTDQGEPQFHVQAVSGGHVADVHIKGSELGALYKKWQARKVRVEEPVPFTGMASTVPQPGLKLDYGRVFNN
jgi:hypothetical protein